MMKMHVLTMIAVEGFAVPAMAQQSSYPDSSAMTPSQDTQRSQTQPNNMSDGQAQGTMRDPQSTQSAPSRSAAQQTQTDSDTPIAAEALDTAKVRDVQQALKDKGELAEGEVDGLWGPKTMEAIREFQRSQNIESADGR